MSLTPGTRWAFGCVLYEMLTGTRAFDGESVVDVLGAVACLEPSFDALPPDVPPRVRRVVQLCLTKDLRQRAQSIGDVRLALDGAFETSAPALVDAAPPLPPPFRTRMLPVATAAVLAGLLGIVAGRVFSPQPEPAAATVTRFAIPLPEGQAFSNTTRNTVAMSPDGTQLVYVADTRLYLRSLSELDPTPIRGTEGFAGITNPVFSPDGESLVFYAQDELRRIDVAGGTPVTLCPATNVFGLSWGPDGIVFGQAGVGIVRVSPDGGTPEVIVAVDQTDTASSPQVLPGGTHVLFTVATGGALDRWDRASIFVQSLATQERTVIVQGGSDGRYLSTGHLVYAIGGGAVFSPDGRWVAYGAGEGNAVTVYVEPFPATGVRYQLPRNRNDRQPHHPQWSPDGWALLYDPAPGVIEAVPVIAAPTFAFENPTRISSSFQQGGPTFDRSWDIAPSGQFIGMVDSTTGAGTFVPEFRVVLNWFEELKRLVQTD